MEDQSQLLLVTMVFYCYLIDRRELWATICKRIVVKQPGGPHELDRTVHK